MPLLFLLHLFLLMWLDMYKYSTYKNAEEKLKLLVWKILKKAQLHQKKRLCYINQSKCNLLLPPLVPRPHTALYE